MTSTRSKRRDYLTLVFIAISISKKLLIKYTKCLRIKYTIPNTKYRITCSIFCLSHDAKVLALYLQLLHQNRATTSNYCDMLISLLLLFLFLKFMPKEAIFSKKRIIQTEWKVGLLKKVWFILVVPIFRLSTRNFLKAWNTITLPFFKTSFFHHRRPLL